MRVPWRLFITVTKHEAMTKPIQEHEFAAELHQLLAAVALGDATDGQIAKLNQLLLSDERLRHQAARFFEEEAVLRREFTMLDRVVEFHTPRSIAEPGRLTAANSNLTHCSGTLLGSIRQRLFLAVALLLCASVAIVLVGHAGNALRQTGKVDGTQIHRLPFEENLESAFANHRLLPMSACILTPVTHVSWSGPQFASEPAEGPPTAMIRDGVISFVSAFGRPAEGYMVSLQPGALLDVVVAGDAEGENALAVIEFDAYGRPTGQRVSFSNSAVEDDATRAAEAKFSPMTKKGRLGVWTERNDGATPRFYLFTGVHKLLNRSSDDSWHVSKLTAFIDEPGLLHLGWDDSGMPTPGDKNLVQHPDNDFDDVTATIRIKSPGAAARLSKSELNVYSRVSLDRVEASQQPVTETERYAFSVAPGQVAVVKVCSRSGAPVEVAIRETASGKVRWRCSKEKATSPNLGICAIENHSARPRDFYLVGRKNHSDAPVTDAATALKCSVLFEQEQFVTVGFDDGDQLATDFYKVRVDILSMDCL